MPSIIPSQELDMAVRQLLGPPHAVKHLAFDFASCICACICCCREGAAPYQSTHACDLHASVHSPHKHAPRIGAASQEHRTHLAKKDATPLFNCLVGTSSLFLKDSWHTHWPCNAVLESMLRLAKSVLLAALYVAPKHMPV